MSIQHFYSQTVADGTATSVVRPSDWNSAHNQVLNMGGNTAGTSQISGADIVWAGGNNITLSANGSTVSVVGPNTVAQTVQTQASGSIAGAGFTTTTAAGAVVAATHNSAGLLMAVPGFLTTAAATNVTSGRAGLGTTLGFTGGITGSMTLNTNGLNLALSELAGTDTWYATGANTIAGTATSGTFSNDGYAVSGAGGVSVGVSNGTLIISGGGGGTINQTGPNIAVAGSTVTAGTVLFSDSPTVSFGMAGSTITASAAGGGGGAALTYLTYQNRQLGASGTTQLTNNQIWMVPFRVAGGVVSASTLQYQMSISGSYTSAAAATHGNTMKWCIYSADATNSSVFNSASSGSLTWQVWLSGTSSGSYAINGVTSSSAGSGIMTQANGMRMLNIPFGSTLNSGLYIMALAQSTSSAGYSAMVSRYGHVMDNPMPLAMGYGFGTVTATSVGYGDAGTYSVTSAAFPSTVNLSQIRQHSNLVPYFKMGAI